MPTQTDSQLDHNPLPTTAWSPMEQVPLTHVNPRYINLVLIESSSLSLIVLILFNTIAIIINLPSLLIVGITTGLILLLSVLALLRNKQAKQLAYAVTQQELLLQQGAIWHKRTSLPYSRLQHVSLSQGPLERRFGLKQLKCFSAGSGTAEVDLSGLDEATAEKLRQHLLHKAGIGSHQSPEQFISPQPDNLKETIKVLEEHLDFNETELSSDVRVEGKIFEEEIAEKKDV